MQQGHPQTRDHSSPPVPADLNERRTRVSSGSLGISISCRGFIDLCDIPDGGGRFFLNLLHVGHALLSSSSCSLLEIGFPAGLQLLGHHANVRMLACPAESGPCH
jgi:hypothetical protein